MTTQEKNAPSKTSKYKRLTSSQRAEAITLWKSGSATLADLAKRFDKSEETFSRLFTREGIKKGESADKHIKKVEKAVEEAIIDDAGELARKIKEVKDEHFKMSRGISKLIWNEIVTANKDKTQLSAKMGNLKALEKAAQGLKIVREESYVVLGIADGEDDDKDNIPELKVQELTTQDILDLQAKASQEASQEEDEGDGIPDIDDSSLVIE